VIGFQRGLAFTPSGSAPRRDVRQVCDSLGLCSSLRNRAKQIGEGDITGERLHARCPHG